MLFSVFTNSYKICSPLNFRITRQSLHKQVKGKCFQPGYLLLRAQSPCTHLPTLQPAILHGKLPKVGTLQFTRTISHGGCSIKANLNTDER